MGNVDNRRFVPILGNIYYIFRKKYIYGGVYVYKVLLEIGNITIYSYGAMIALGVLSIIYLAGKIAKDIGLTSDNIIDLVVAAVVGGVIGSRIYYVLAYNFDYYLQNPWQIFNIREGGLVFFGGLIGGALAVIGLIYYKKWPIWEIADLAGLFVPLGYFFGRIGCFLNGCCYGVATNCFLGVAFPSLDGQKYHPTMLYSAILGLGLFFFALWYRKKRRFAGESFLYYLIFYSIGRFFIEFLRENPKVFNILTVAQVTGIVTIIVSLILYPYLRRKNAYKEKDDVKEMKSA